MSARDASTPPHDRPAGRRRVAMVIAASGVTLALAAVAAWAVSWSSPPAAGAATAPPASLYLSPADGIVTAGDTVTVEVRLRSDNDAVNAVQADLDYPPSRLDYVGAQVNSTVWSVTAAVTGGSGHASVQVGSTAPVTGDTLVATVTFTAKQDGPTDVAVASSSVALSAGTNTNLLAEPPGSDPPGGDPNSTPPDDNGPATDPSTGAVVTPVMPVAARLTDLRWRGRTLRARVSCPQSAPSPCRVRLAVRSRAGRTVAAHSVTLGPARARGAKVTIKAAMMRRLRARPAAYRLHVRTVTAAGVTNNKVHLPGLRR